MEHDLVRSLVSRPGVLSYIVSAFVAGVAYSLGVAPCREVLLCPLPSYTDSKPCTVQYS